MCLGIVVFVASIYMLIMTERGRRNPHLLKDSFMFRNGYTRSFLALWYFFGRPEEARNAIVEDAQLRQKFMVESYVWIVVGLAAGLFLMIRSVVPGG